MLLFLLERLTVSITMFVGYDLKLKKDIFTTNHHILKSSLGLGDP